MNIKLTVFALFIFISSTVHSQDSCVKKFEERTLFQYGNHYQLNGKPLRFKELKVELNKFDDAAAENLLFHKGSTVSGIVALSGLIMELTGALVYKNNKGLGNGLLIGAGVGLLVSLPISISAGHHLQKAVWLYNKNAMRY